MVLQNLQILNFIVSKEIRKITEINARYIAVRRGGRRQTRFEVWFILCLYWEWQSCGKTVAEMIVTIIAFLCLLAGASSQSMFYL